MWARRPWFMQHLRWSKWTLGQIHQPVRAGLWETVDASRTTGFSMPVMKDAGVAICIISVKLEFPVHLRWKRELGKRAAEPCRTPPASKWTRHVSPQHVPSHTDSRSHRRAGCFTGMITDCVSCSKPLIKHASILNPRGRRGLYPRLTVKATHTIQNMPVLFPISIMETI